MLKKLVIGIAILAASLGYGCVAHAQTPCTGGQCQVQQATYATPVRNAVYATAQAVTQATAPKCQGEHKGLFERIAERREQRKAQRGGGCCR